MKVYVIWDRLYERVIGVYSSEAHAQRGCDQLDETWQSDHHEYDEFEIDAEPEEQSC